MNALNYTILYVANPKKSAEFYQRLFQTEPVVTEDIYYMFVLQTGRLGLWAIDDTQPPATKGPSQSELVFTLGSREEVDACCRLWQQHGAEILQQPSEMDFGYTFTCSDPDGHRLRVYVYEE